MKTPEQEAKELVEKFEESLNHISMGSNGIEDMLHERAVACALIHVNEMLNLCDKEMLFENASHYQSVKTAIEKL